ncbi:hypothetical protein [Agromyces sp. NPDC060279]|uniref:hypothetical protein n=1 Tax=Agromyces sp. NPDC060279 TaxID=3347092 RepID=UPI0036536AC0
MDADTRRAESGQHGDLVTLLGGIQMLIAAAPTAEMLRDVLAQVAEKRVGLVFENFSMHMVEVSETLNRRYGITRVLLRGSDRPSPADVEIGEVFASASGQMSDTIIGLAAYLNPLFTSLSPAVWGFAVGRPGAAIVLLFGELVDGTAKDHGDTLRLYTPGHGSQPIREYPSTATWGSYQAALKWWLQRLDVLFGELTNLELAAVGGVFDPERALQIQFTVERLFRAAQSVGATVRDPFARRAVAFEALESLVGLNRSWTTESLLSLSYARERLARLETALPGDVAKILLPRARAGVEALRQVQDGFFIRTMRDGDALLLPDKNGVESPYRLERAAAMWLRLMRNAQHGFDRELNITERTLLMAHDGEMPKDLPDLLWLYVLDVLTFPHGLKPRPRSQRRGR